MQASESEIGSCGFAMSAEHLFSESFLNATGVRDNLIKPLLDVDLSRKKSDKACQTDFDSGLKVSEENKSKSSFMLLESDSIIVS